ncbi:hypothetical protein [Leifsonia shinshuensis]|uniref:DUF1648 domain-containing protein n=1 Tax=Leifsonia shinshuensis TaxID=150026 RepID=A0A7G6YC83_9MICO|nr:hypothetical protein [Leifsonia shinshuensis]QNE36098.1 hypothetical protein F1C12_13875 [Leifsonia shinshuensis]
MWLPGLGILVSWLLLRDELPETMVTQWSGRTPSSWAPTGLVLAVTGSVSVVSAACAGRSDRRGVWIAVGFSALGASAWLVLALANVQTIPSVGGWGLLTPLAFLYGGVAAALTRPASPHRAAGNASSAS